jgi:hypothetical protein
MTKREQPRVYGSALSTVRRSGGRRKNERLVARRISLAGISRAGVSEQERRRPPLDIA